MKLKSKKEIKNFQIRTSIETGSGGKNFGPLPQFVSPPYQGKMKRSRDHQLDAYRIGGRVSETSYGGGGEVFTCVRVRDNLKLAVKIINKNKSNENNSQISMMERLDHQNVLRLIDWFEDENYIFIFVELASGGDLWERIAKSIRIPEAQVALISFQLLNAIHHVHSRGIVHCDIKPENILFSRSGDEFVKLADFGSAQAVGTSNDRKIVSTISYAAPELLDGLPPSTASDLWSLGVLMYTMLSGFPPFGQHPAKTPMLIREGRLIFPQSVFEHVSQDARDLIGKLLVKDPTNRLSAEDALAHPWFNNCSA
mmetsp:Transcript_61398/g.164918  ORF Transcript_61398/g.164918 Transcript_61398/m.164918 type:complete len:311 (+) Transcript_61398:71-1003(+)